MALVDCADWFTSGRYWGNIGCVVLPDQVAISHAHQVFDSDGALTDQKQHERVLRLGRTLAETAGKLTA